MSSFAPPGRTIREAAFSGLELREVAFGGATCVGEHEHDHAQFCLLLSGTCTEVLRDRTRTYGAPTALFYKDAETHRFRIHERGARCFKIVLDDAWLTRLRTVQDGVVSLFEPLAGTLAHQGMRAYREFRAMDAFSPVSVEGIVLEMLASVARRAKAANATTSIVPPRWLDRAVAYVEEHVLEPLTVVAVANAVERHPVHVARVFARHHGRSIGEFVRERRVAHACRELATGKPLSAIAAETGFSDQSHFTRVFKLVTGTTPARYRAAIRA